MNNNKIGRIIVFILIFCVLFVGLGFLFQPVWYYWNNYDTTHGFYEEPENTIEALFLGASVTANAITPMELYEDYGICAYNFGTEQQPMLASYYWLEEVYRFHSDSLRTVVLDTSMLRNDSDLAFYRKALDSMRFSKIKYYAVRDYTENFLETLSYLNPFFSYHSRWSDMTETDFIKAKYEPNTAVRGYHFSTEQYIDDVSYDKVPVPAYYVDKKAEQAVFNIESMYYLEKMIDFCDNNQIELVLMKTPVISYWNSSEHNAVEAIAEKYDLIFLDFNYEPLLSEIGYNHASDSMDCVHLNYYGAAKFTAWIGHYLVENCQVTDVRGNQKYDYLDIQLEKYKKQIKDVIGLIEETNPVDYLANSMGNDDYTIFVMVKDEASTMISNEQRERFADLGLHKLSTLQFRDSYLAVIKNGKVVYEDSDDLDEVGLEERDTTENKDGLPISYYGNLQDGTFFILESGGTYGGNVASCKLDGTEYSQNERGINIVVYDCLRHRVIDTTNFDTYISETRDSKNMEVALLSALAEGKTYKELSYNLQELYKYNYICEKAYNAAMLKENVGNDGMLDFLNYYQNEKNIVIFISVLDEASKKLDESVRNAFKNIGLIELSELGFRDSYIAIIDEGKVSYEQRDHGQKPISVNGIGYSLTSAGGESGTLSSIIIGDSEYSRQQRGFNVVVYDKELQLVIDTASFDTFEVPIRLPAQRE